MTLAQLKYVVTVAKAGTMTEAAKELFISQPSLTKSIKELEKEMHVRIFDRTNKGIVVSKDGEEFLACKTGVGTGRTSGRKIHE